MAYLLRAVFGVVDNLHGGCNCFLRILCSQKEVTKPSDPKNYCSYIGEDVANKDRSAASCYCPDGHRDMHSINIAAFAKKKRPAPTVVLAFYACMWVCRLRPWHPTDVTRLAPNDNVGALKDRMRQQRCLWHLYVYGPRVYCVLFSGAPRPCVPSAIPTLCI